MRQKIFSILLVVITQPLSIVHASAIITAPADGSIPYGPSGWTNEFGNFQLVGPSLGHGADGGLANFNDPLFSWRTSSPTGAPLAVSGNVPRIELGTGVIQIAAAVEPNDTPSGDLFAGILTIRLADGTVLLVGNAIDAYASGGPDVGGTLTGVSFLFHVVYRDPVLAPFSDYLTFVDPIPYTLWTGGPGQHDYQPWAGAWSSVGGFTAADLTFTTRIPAPTALSLVVSALLLLLASRRKATSERCLRVRPSHGADVPTSRTQAA